VYTEDKCLINQREIGLDVCDFETGMKHAVREDPDVMLVGEMRDRETFMTAIRSAIAFNMRGLVAQKLLPSIKPGVSRVPTVEIMTFNGTVKKLILEENDSKLPDAIRIGAREGM